MVIRILILTFGLLLPGLLRAEGVPFNVQGESTENAVAELKQKAIQNYLAKQLGARYTALAEQVTAEFAENYVLDYQIGKAAGGKETTLTGHIDAKALMRWVRLTETKTRTGGSIRTGLVLSSDFPQAPFQPGETARRVNDHPTAKILHALASGALEKFNVNLSSIGDARFPLDRPPRQDSDVQALREYGAVAGLNTIFWANLSACAACGGAKVTLSFYNLFQDRPGVVRSQNLRLDPSALSSGTGLKDVFNTAFESFGKELEDTISSGTLTSRILRVVVERIPNYKAFRVLQDGMGRLDFLAKATLKRTEPFLAEYEVYSSLAPNELSQRFQGAPFEGFDLQTVKVESTGLVVRYVAKNQ